MSVPAPLSPVSSRNVSLQNDTEATALPLTDLSNLPTEMSNRDSVRSESFAETQDGSISKRAPSNLLSILSNIWSSTSMFVLPIVLFWKEEQLDLFWEEVPKRIEKYRIQDYTEGIPQLAAFIASSDDFCVWRSFSQLHNRVALHRMLEINKLETALNEMDASDDLLLETRHRVRTVEQLDDDDTIKKDLIDNIERKLLLYDDLILKKHAIMCIPEPSRCNYESVLNWVMKESPLQPGDVNYIFKRKDFVRLGRRSQNDQFVDKVLRWTMRWAKSPLIRIFRDMSSIQDGTVHFHSAKRLAFFIKAFFVGLVIAILMVPIVLLFLVPMQKVLMIVVVLISLFVFAITLSFFRDSRPQDLFFGTATYCAVLLVFLAQGNFSSAH